MRDLRRAVRDTALAPAYSKHSRCLSRAHVASCKSRVCLSVLASSAILDESSVASAQSGAVVSQLVGKKVVQLSRECSAVPLLHPITHNLPFAASLQIFSDSSSQGSASSVASSTMPLSSRQHVSSGSLVELHYVISGKGYFSNAASGVQQALWPGDSIISLHGAANFAAGPLPNQDPKQQDSTAQQQTSSPAWSQLLGWLQHLHTKQQHNSGAQQSSLSSSPAAAATAGTAAGQHGSSNQLVMLQLLLPSELLTGEMLSHHAGHGLAVAQQLPWGPAALQQSAGGVSLHGLAPAGSILEAQVCGLLVDGGLGSPESQPAQQSMQEDQQEDQQQQTQEKHEHPVQSSSNSNSSNSEGGSMSAHILPGLDQQQISKRALSEVGAFRLPQQTNRLALLFGPHCSPAVCCSFGVEVFEPGHVTPLHIHNTAHELFFVLAGKGEAVFKAAGGSGLNSEGLESRQPQRVSVSPGDVAVFAPGIVHGVDNLSGSQLYCLQMMLPNEFFVEFVRSGEEAGRLDVTAVQRIAAAASCG